MMMNIDINMDLDKESASYPQCILQRTRAGPARVNPDADKFESEYSTSCPFKSGRPRDGA